jgi:hypothetical protein
MFFFLKEPTFLESAEPVVVKATFVGITLCGACKWFICEAISSWMDVRKHIRESKADTTPKK